MPDTTKNSKRKMLFYFVVTEEAQDSLVFTYPCPTIKLELVIRQCVGIGLILSLCHVTEHVHNRGHAMVRRPPRLVGTRARA
jgi:hypothetical protein